MDGDAFYAALVAGVTPGEALSDLLRRPAWHADALCREHPGVEFFPTRGSDVRPAKSVCARCSVSEECLSDALDAGDLGKFGIWGGLSERERRQIRKRRNAA